MLLFTAIRIHIMAAIMNHLKAHVIILITLDIIRDVMVTITEITDIITLVINGVQDGLSTGIT